MATMWIVAGIEVLGYLGWSLGWMFLLTTIGFVRGWPTWVSLFLTYALTVPYWLWSAYACYLLIPPSEAPMGLLFFIGDHALAVKFAWHAWSEWKNNHTPKRKPARVFARVVNLGHRLALGDA